MKSNLRWLSRWWAGCGVREDLHFRLLPMTNRKTCCEIALGFPCAKISQPLARHVSLPLSCCSSAIITFNKFNLQSNIYKTLITKKRQEIMSDEILAWGGSSSFMDGFRFWLKQDSRNLTNASECCSMVPVSLKFSKIKLLFKAGFLYKNELILFNTNST